MKTTEIDKKLWEFQRIYVGREKVPLKSNTKSEKETFHFEKIFTLIQKRNIQRIFNEWNGRFAKILVQALVNQRIHLPNDKNHENCD